MLRERIFPIATALLAVLVLAIVAPVLESTPVSSPYEVSTSTDSDGSEPLMSRIFLLVFAILEFFGIEPESAAPMGDSPLADFLAVVISHLPTLIALFVAGLVLGVLVLAGWQLPPSVSKRLLCSLRGDARTADIPSQSRDETWPPVDPESGVAGAWFDMTASVDVDHPASRTPTEWADAAVDDGLDPDAVLSLTALFTEVKYGGAPETLERRRQANRELDRLEDDSG